MESFKVKLRFSDQIGAEKTIIIKVTGRSLCPVEAFSTWGLP